MSEVPARPPRRGLRRPARLLPALLLGAVVAAVLAALALPWWFDARRVTGLALERASTATGLDWRIDGEPELHWRPRPWLALNGLTVRDAQGRVLLAAERIELALPWSTLRGESLRIEALRIDAPVLDLDAALDWWNAQPAAAEPTLPIIDGLIVGNGRLRSGGTEIDRFELALPRFAVGETLRLEVSARIRLPAPVPNAEAAEPFIAAIDLLATPETRPLRLEDLQLRLAGSGAMPDANANGRIQFAPWQLALDGEIAAWPEAWPALPAPLSASRSPIAFRITQHGESALAALAVLSLRRDDLRVEARAVPAGLLAWVEDAAAPALPPLRGQATLPAIELDGMRLQGVRIEIDGIEDIDPTTTSKAAPATEPQR